MGAPTDLPTSASLQVTPELVAFLSKQSQALAEAEAYTIDSPELAVIVNDQLKDVKKRLASVEEWDQKFAEPIRQLEKTRQAFFGPAKQSLAAAEQYFKRLLAGWTEKERQRVAEENRRREEEARKVREQAERDAAAARARAAAQAEEARRKAQEAEAAERKAREEGDARAAAAAAAAKARAEEEERQRLAEGERKAQEKELSAAAMPAPATAEVQKLAGFSQRKNWIAELAPDTTEEQAKTALVQAIVGGRGDLLALLTLDMKAATKLAKALETRFNVPGLKARNAPISTSKG